LNLGSGRYRSQFCNDSPTLRDDIDATKVHQHEGSPHSDVA
jgi:hypothetical protein